MQFLMQVIFGRIIGKKEKGLIVLPTKPLKGLSLQDLNLRPSD